MPLTKHGRKVRAAMRRRYGRSRGDRVFYATTSSRRGGRDKIGGKRIHRTRRRR